MSASATVLVAIERQPIENAPALNFNRKLFEGTITDDLLLSLEKLVLDEENFSEQVTVQMTGTHSNLFVISRSAREVTVRLGDGVSFNQLPLDQYVNL